MKKVLILSSVASAALLLFASWASSSVPAAGQVQTQPGITAIDPFPADLANRGWSKALEFVEGRVRQWYAEANVDQMTTAELEQGIASTSKAIAERPENAPDELWWLREMQLRREVLCQSLPEGNALRSDYCSPTSYPGFTLSGA